MLAASSIHLRGGRTARREGDNIILRIELAARAEATADIVFDVVHGLFGEIHHRGHGAFVEERKLRGARDGQASRRFVPFRE